METSKRRLYWRLCYGGVFVLSVLAFTPLVIPSGVVQPIVLGMPYTLWVGILLTVVLVGLTYVATRLYPVVENSTDQRSETNDPNEP